jgi:polar amino acid transport system substrate-binding protein
MKWIWLTLFIAAPVLVSIPAAAQDMMVITEEYPPLSYSRDGSLSGVSVEIVREILRRLDQPDAIMMMPWARGYHLLKTKANVILFSTTRTKEREDLFHWVGPLCAARNGFYRKKGSDIQIDSLEDARKVASIATYKDDAREQMLKSLGFDNLDSSNSAESNLKKLISGRVDLWFYDNLGIPYVAKQTGVDLADLELALAVDEVSLYIAISKQTPAEIVERWRVAFESMQQDGTFLSISKKWLHPSSIPKITSSALGVTKQSIPLKIYTEDSPPANYARNGKPAGMAVEIVTEILNRLGKDATIEIVPWARGYRMALNRPNVALFSTTRLPQREKLFKWVGPLYIQQWGFYAKKGSNIRINSLDDAKKVGSIGTYLNDAKEQFLTKKGFTNLITTNKNTSNIRHLLNGNIDLWVSSDFNVPYLAHQAGVSPDQLELVFAFKRVENYIAFSNRTQDETIAAWRQAFAAMQRDGSFERIVSKTYP